MKSTEDLYRTTVYRVSGQPVYYIDVETGEVFRHSYTLYVGLRRNVKEEGQLKRLGVITPEQVKEAVRMSEEYIDPDGYIENWLVEAGYLQHTFNSGFTPMTIPTGKA